MERTPEWRNYDTAVTDLAASLCTVWRSCEVTGANLPEALSYALGLAARDLVREMARTDPLGYAGGGADQDLAVGVLVRHRPGSWEADLVAQLTYPVDLLGDPEDAAPA